MFTLITLLIIIISLTLFIMMLASGLSKKMILEREKSSPFECGFDPFSSPRLPFSLRFFLIAVIFLIFDVEIAILLPLPIIMKFSTTNLTLFVTVFFLFILIIGLFHEWRLGALTWT